MDRKFTIRPSLPFTWVEMNTDEEYAGIRERCTMEYLSEKLKGYDVELASVELNDTGVYEEPGKLFGFIEHSQEKDLPAYYRVILKKKMHGGHVATITIHIPLVWNERFAGLTGGGSASYQDYQQYLFASSTPWTIAIRNHFACAQTDCSIGFDNYGWGFKKDSGEPDWDLLKEWGYEAAHDVAVYGKLVTSIVYGKDPVFSYISGISAGGRTTHGEVQRYPEDYNGAWVQCAAAPWIPHLISQTWPYFVMNHENHSVAKAKVQAFYQGMLQKYGCEEKGYLDSCYYPEFDPYSMVGEETEAGVITEEDARVMKLIYGGPHYSDGRPMSKCDSLGASIRYAPFLAYDEEGNVPSGVLSQTAIQGFRWVLNRPDMSFADITREDLDRLYDIAVSSYKDLDNQDPDISGFRNAGGKLILTHATSDNCVPVTTTMKYYNNVVRYAGGEEEARDYTACFISRGGGHGDRMGVGEIMAFPDVWAAMMKWVEDGEKPEELPTQTWNAEKQSVEYTGRKEKTYSVRDEENRRIERLMA